MKKTIKKVMLYVVFGLVVLATVYFGGLALMGVNPFKKGFTAGENRITVKAEEAPELRTEQIKAWWVYVYCIDGETMQLRLPDNWYSVGYRDDYLTARYGDNGIHRIIEQKKIKGYDVYVTYVE